MSLTKTASDYYFFKKILSPAWGHVASSSTREAIAMSGFILCNELSTDLKTNWIYKMFELNEYDPVYARSMLYGWCQKKVWEKKHYQAVGTTAMTGKTNIAKAISHAAPFYGCVIEPTKIFHSMIASTRWPSGRKKEKWLPRLLSLQRSISMEVLFVLTKSASPLNRLIWHQWLWLQILTSELSWMDIQ